MPRLVIHSAAILAAFLLACPVVAQDRKQIERELNSTYSGKVVTLRNSYSGSVLRYDHAGELFSGGPAGPWTLAGRVKVKKISLKQDKIEIQADRQLVMYDDRKKDFYEHSSWQKVKIEVAPGTTQNTTVDWKKAVDRIFVPADETWQSTLPPHWREFFQTKEPQSILQMTKDLAPGEKNEPDERGIYRVGKGVSFPQCVSCPQPRYNDAARKKRLSGLVILWVVLSSEGRLEEFHIAKPLGAGLDEASLETMKGWRFEPARRDGRPVPVYMTVEMHFNLY